MYDTIKFVGSLFDIPITKEMKASVSSARSKYMLYLEDGKKLKVLTGKEKNCMMKLTT